MKDNSFDELVTSIREAGIIRRGEARPSRTFTLEDPDVAAIRKEYGLTQSEFATLLGISPRTLENWEQGHRKPQGPAKVLLRVAARHPEAVLDTVASES